MSDLACSGCGETVASREEATHVRLSAMQAHDRDCTWHDVHGVPCRHEGSCYKWLPVGGETDGE